MFSSQAQSQSKDHKTTCRKTEFTAPGIGNVPNTIFIDRLNTCDKPKTTMVLLPAHKRKRRTTFFSFKRSNFLERRNIAKVPIYASIAFSPYQPQWLVAISMPGKHCDNRMLPTNRNAVIPHVVLLSQILW